MLDLTLAFDLVFILLAAFIGGSLAAAFRQPPMAGYILGGLLFGPQALGLVRDSTDIRTLAEVGVAFLMFTVGLEFPLSRIRDHSKVVILGVVIQLLISTASAVVLTGVLGISLSQALFFGVLLGFSSTAVVVKTLLSQGEMSTTHGELSSSWLILQDLAVLPTLVILVSLGGENVVLDLGGGIIKAVVFLAVAIYLGTRFVPRVLSQIASSSREIFLLAAIILVLGVAFVTRQLGLSFALGGFLAGMIVAESPFKEQLFVDVKNIRDLFATLFFVSVGILVSPIFILTNLPAILLILVLMAAVKLVVITVWIYKFGYHLKTSLLTGLALIQIGEFSFVVANLGLERNFIDANIYQLVLATALISLLLTPLIISHSARIYHFLHELVLKRIPGWHHLFTKYGALTPLNQAADLKDHVLVIGYGRVGKYLSHALSRAGIDHIISDIDIKKLSEPMARGIASVYGDAAEDEILELMGVRSARAVVITHGEPVGTKLTIHRVRKVSPNMKILARASRDADFAELKDLAIYRVVQPEFEASLSITHKVLDFFGVSKPEIEDLLRKLRREHHG